MVKLALGTAQFGIDYGINNQRGKVPPREVGLILDQASGAGIELLDTAAAYGESETVIGAYLKESGGTFKVVSKVPKGPAEMINETAANSLAVLGLRQLYGYLVHDFASFIADRGLWLAVQGLRAAGKVEKIGFSLYYPAELDHLLENKIAFDLLQVPYNVFDRRFEKYFPELKRRQIEVHTRSAFLQGLVFKAPIDLTPEFHPLKEKLQRLNSLAKEHALSIVSVCLNFCLVNESIDRVVVGVDSLANLSEILKAAEEIAGISPLLSRLNPLNETDENLLVPANWGRLREGVASR